MKLVAISASVLAHERRSYLEAGFDAFVGKPFRFGEICETLRRLLKVEFTYAEEKPEPATVNTPPDPRELVLPAAVRQQLREAAKRHSVTKLEQAFGEMERLGGAERNVAEYLRGLLRSGKLEAMAEFVEKLRSSGFSEE